TIGIQQAGGAANTGEGGEDPAWYVPGPDGRRHDARIKQVASARFGVTAAYLARADQLEIKIAQGSKPGEGGQLPGRKATAYIAALRRGRPGQSYISPPPHHDIYSIEDLAQLVADLRAIAPRARIGVKLVASRGIGTIAAGVAKAGADYVHVSGHAGGTGASPLSSIKHAGVPWELGLAEVHQVLLRNGLRDRIAVRVDGGLHTGRDLLVAALFGAEEFGFGTAALVAIGCDMARQCHLDTCPTGIATQREDLRAKFAGTPEDIVRFFTAIAEDLRHELALVGARSVGEVVGRAAELLAPARGSTLRLDEILCCGEWTPEAWRRDEPAAAGLVVRGAAASGLEETIVTAAVAGAGVVAGGRVVAGAGVVPGPRVVPGAPVEGGPRVVAGAPVEGGAGAAAGGGVGGVAGVAAGDLTLTTADRSFGARLSGALARGELHGPVRLGLRGAAGQSLGAFLAPGIELVFTGVANDYVAKGLSGGTLVVRPEHDFGADPAGQAIAGNTCLYGATAGRLHLIGRAGMRFAVRNSGADAVVEGIGPHGCEYMTGGIVVVLGPTGPNFGAGMTGGRAYLWCPEGSAPNGLATGLRSIHLSALVGDRPDAPERVAELRALVAAHAAAGSSRAAGLLADPQPIESRFWLIEPVDLPSAHEPIAVGAERPAPRPAHAGEGQRPVRTPASAQNPQPTRNRLVTGHPLNGRAGEP
ncbi:MAG TPA: glutamate synthase-related protein, partial [Candidatus Limnocylindrales bacterium]